MEQQHEQVIHNIHLFFIYLFGVLHRFQHYTGHITTGSWKGRGNQYIQFVRVLYCKLPTKGKQLPAFPLEAMPGTNPRPQRREARVLPLCYCSHSSICSNVDLIDYFIYRNETAVSSAITGILFLPVKSIVK